jgi:N-acetylmuramoyl-L-alanine amidase
MVTNGGRGSRALLRPAVAALIATLMLQAIPFAPVAVVRSGVVVRTDVSVDVDVPGLPISNLLPPTALPAGVRPSTITVFLDPGHGGSDGGAEATAADGSLVREADLDLDIALRLAAMLRASGIRVAMSRTSDVPANTPRRDRSGDGDIDGYDEFLARIDGANLVRADLFVAIHNNWIPDGRGRTEAFYCGQGCVGSEASRALAAAILDAHVARPAPLQTADWQLSMGNPAIDEARRNPTDDVLRFGYATLPAGRHFYVLGPYDETFRPRAIQMPGVLMESLALSHPTELELLQRPEVRDLIAAAYRDGIARWLSSRSFGVRLDPAGEPANLHAGRTTTLRVRVTNNGSTTIPAGSRVIVGSRPATLPYDGAFNSGSGIGSYVLRAALAPGRSTVLPVSVRPREAGRATWKVDLVVGGVRAAALRVPVLQYQVAVAP